MPTLKKTRFSRIKRSTIFCALIYSLCLNNVAFAEVIDILLVYDTTASSWVNDNGGMEVFSQDAVNKMNQAMQNSNLNHSFRLVHSMSVNYTSSWEKTLYDELYDDLMGLRDGTGVLEAVHTARDTYRADLVAMLVDTGESNGVCGLSAGYNAKYYYDDIPGLNEWYKSFGVSVSAIQCVDLGDTLTHEVGHNLGAGHSKSQLDYTGPDDDDVPYSAGWYFTGTNGVKYATLMAYIYDGYGGYYQRTPMFSTPLLEHEGTPAGDVEDGDNRRRINETIGIVASFRNPTLTGITVSGPETVNEDSFATYTAIASWSDGTTSTVSPIWSEDSEYTTINLTGVLTTASVTGDNVVTVSASFTSEGETQTGTHTVTVINVASIGESVDNTSLTWTTGGDADWFTQSTIALSGGNAIQSGNIADGQESYIQTSVTGPGKISFSWQVSSENLHDYLRFYIDGVEQPGSISGTTSWSTETFTIPAGLHTLKWAYTKDAISSSTSDCGWIDQIDWVADPTFPWVLFVPAMSAK